MNSSHCTAVRFTSAHGPHTITINRATDLQWQALEDDEIVGRADVSPRPDGKLFVSVDAWHREVYDNLARVMLAALPRPLFTIVDEGDSDTRLGWQRLGFSVRQREAQFVLATDPTLTGLATAPKPQDIRLLPVGAAQPALLRDAYDMLRAEIDSTVGWDAMPAELISRRDGSRLLDPAVFAVAAQHDRYVGLLRLAPLPRPRIRLIAVRSELHRHGIARALLAEVLGALHRRGIETAYADVLETNAAATALFTAIDGRRASSSLQLVLR